MNNKLKIGDRVKLSGRSWSNQDVDGYKGTVVKLEEEDGYIDIKIENHHRMNGVLVLREQCKRLIPKKPKLTEQEIRKQEQQKASDTVMDLFYAMKSIKGDVTLQDLVKLAKRIKGIYE